mgnify:CR=1 FL=1
MRIFHVVLGVVWRLWLRNAEAKLGLTSAGVAFFGFLAIFPALAAVIAVWGFASDPEVIYSQMAALKELLPSESYDLLETQVRSLVAANGRNIGWTTIVSTLFAMWSARAGAGALIQGLDEAYGHVHREGIWHILQAIMLTMVLMTVALASIVAAVIVPLVLAILPLGQDAATWLERVNEMLGVSVVIVGMWFAYRFGPNHPENVRPLIWPGLLLAGVLWIVTSRGFMFYLARFATYNHIYGGIGAVVVLLMWFWLSVYSVLLGAALNAVLRPEDDAPVPRPAGQ